jgi:hypothetical protein
MPPRIAIYVFGMNETQLRKLLGEPTELVRKRSPIGATRFLVLER